MIKKLKDGLLGKRGDLIWENVFKINFQFYLLIISSIMVIWVIIYILEEGEGLSWGNRESKKYVAVNKLVVITFSSRFKHRHVTRLIKL